MKTPYATRRIYTRPGKINTATDDFVCRYCGAFITAEISQSGVRNRNHCPYCLASRHLDLFEAGDRLSACKARMKPVGLTLKRLTKRYAGNSQGELMLIHLCEDCSKVSINRIAADDSNEMILSVLEKSDRLAPDTLALLAQHDITPLRASQSDLVQEYLFGIQAPSLIRDEAD